ARGQLISRTVSVADLVLPVENYSPLSSDHLLRTSAAQTTTDNKGVQPYVGRNAMQGGTEVSPGTLGSMAAVQNNSGWQKHGAKGTIEDVLIKLITNAISPSSWNDMGGPGTIDYFPLGMALVINQTPDIQEQIADLLAALRRLQDQEVAVEVRFITIAESFFERIGLDFNVNFKTNNTRY